MFDSGSGLLTVEGSEVLQNIRRQRACIARPHKKSPNQGRLLILMEGLGDGSPTISKMGEGGCHERITLKHHFVLRPLLPLLGLFTSVYAPTSIPPTVPMSPTLW